MSVSLLHSLLCTCIINSRTCFALVPMPVRINVVLVLSSPCDQCCVFMWAGQLRNITPQVARALGCPSARLHLEILFWHKGERPFRIIHIFSHLPCSLFQSHYLTSFAYHFSDKVSFSTTHFSCCYFPELLYFIFISLSIYFSVPAVSFHLSSSFMFNNKSRITQTTALIELPLIN